jgi:hypothetical protein
MEAEDNGDHLLQFFNQSGQLVLSKDIYIDEKTKRFTMNIPSIIPGSYFAKLTWMVNVGTHSLLITHYSLLITHYPLTNVLLRKIFVAMVF